MLADPSSYRMANCIAAAGHKLAGSSVLHLLAHRGVAHTSTHWYSDIARDVVDKVASSGTHCRMFRCWLAVWWWVGWFAWSRFVRMQCLQYVSPVSECVCVCGCVCVGLVSIVYAPCFVCGVWLLFAVVLHSVVLQGAALVNLRNGKHRTPLFLAAGAGNLVVCQLLLQKGAGPLRTHNVTAPSGCTVSDQRTV